MRGRPEAPIVAGIDGSPPSFGAARWAAAEAQRRHQDLRLLFAYTIPIVGHPEYEFPPEFAAAVRSAGQQTLDEASDDLNGQYPHLDIMTTLVESDARSALVEASATAGITVVGSRGGGRLAEVLLGSVALHLVSHGHSPVAVIPPGAPKIDGPILVGVDGSATSTAAIAFAFDEAAVRGSGLVAVLAWDDLAHQPFARRPVVMGPADDQEEEALLSEQLTGWREKYPDVPVRHVVDRGRPAEALLRYGYPGTDEQQPQLIVVGSRGRGGFTGLLLGSTSHTLITHAPCPIVVVRPPAVA